MRMYLKSAVIGVLMLSAIETGLASWKYISLEDMVKKSPLIVVGRIESITYADPNDEAEPKYDVGHIRITKVLKNELEDEDFNAADELPLSMPSAHRKFRKSIDIRYDKGAEGVWLLHYSEGRFWAWHPIALQPFSKQAEIAAMIEEQSNNIEKLAEGNNQFALDLYEKIKQGSDGNVFFSPYSISTALAMTYAGARGETAEQMAEVLNFNLPEEDLHRAFGKLQSDLQADKQKKKFELHIANALWGQKGYKFLDEFLDLTRENYGAGLKEVNFVRETEKARKTINEWVEEKTRDKIKDLIKPGVLNKLTRLVLTNAIYFKGLWLIQFDKEKTKEAQFSVKPQKTVQVPMMYVKEDFKYFSNDEAQIIELPYKGEQLSMLVFLPKEKGGLKSMEKSLTLRNIRKWTNKLQKQEVIVYLPRFKFVAGPIELRGVLSDMGMKNAFAPPPVADFSGMTGSKDLFISNVVHKAFVDVNEEGTEAAAATGVVMKITAIIENIIFRADHPFIFVIQDNSSKSILFIGRVVNPAQDS